MVLLVEDEDLVRGLVRGFLERAGYTVIEASTADEAVTLAAAHAGAIRGLLSDVMLPGLDGTKLGKQLRQEIPDLKIVYMSGNLGESVAHGDVLQAGTRFLEKPFTRHELLEAVHDLIGPPGEGPPDPSRSR
jgi:DNA-binding response OmpR family regulator